MSRPKKIPIFQFKMGRSKRADVDPVRAIPKTSGEPELIGYVQGRMPGSIQEWRVAKGLDKLGMKYQYQVEIGGGSTVRGGQIIDFLVFTNPLPTPLQVVGEYWHRNAMLEKIKDQEIKRSFNGQIMDTVSIYADQADTINNTYTLLREVLT